MLRIVSVKCFLRILGALLTVLCLLLCIAWLYRDVITSLVVQQLRSGLRAKGITHIEASKPSISLLGSRLSEVVVEGGKPPHLKFKAELRDVRLAPVWSTLLKTARIDANVRAGVGSTAELELLNHPFITKPLELVLRKPMNLSYSSGRGTLVAQGELGTALLELNWPAGVLSSSDIVARVRHFRRSQSDWKLSGNLHSEEVSWSTIKLRTDQALKFSPDLALNVTPGKASASGIVDVLEYPQFKFQVEGVHSYAESVGEARLELPVTDLSVQPLRLESGDFELPVSLEINGGSLAGLADVTWSEGSVKSELDITAERLSGQVAEYAFSGVSWSAHILPGESQLVSDSELKLAEFDAGVAIRSVKARLSLSKLKSGIEVLLRRISLSLLESEVAINALRLRGASLVEPATIVVTGLELERLFELYTKQQIGGYGTLDGELKVAKGRDEPLIQGEFVARSAGGLIEYRGTLPEQAQLRLALTALKNYKFESLRAKLSFKRSGDLLVEAALKGYNPDLAQELGSERPIELNLSIEENVYALLQSLNMVSDVTERVRRKAEGKQIGRWGR